MGQQTDHVLTVKEVSQELRVSTKRVIRWIKSGELVAIYLGKDYRIFRSDLAAFINKRRTKSPEEDTKPPDADHPYSASGGFVP